MRHSHLEWARPTPLAHVRKKNVKVLFDASSVLNETSVQMKPCSQWNTDYFKKCQNSRNYFIDVYTVGLRVCKRCLVFLGNHTITLGKVFLFLIEMAGSPLKCSASPYIPAFQALKNLKTRNANCGEEKDWERRGSSLCSWVFSEPEHKPGQRRLLEHGVQQVQHKRNRQSPWGLDWIQHWEQPVTAL